LDPSTQLWVRGFNQLIAEESSYGLFLIANKPWSHIWECLGSSYFRGKIDQNQGMCGRDLL
jgi:hypothetical protein